MNRHPGGQFGISLGESPEVFNGQVIIFWQVDGHQGDTPLSSPAARGRGLNLALPAKPGINRRRRNRGEQAARALPFFKATTHENP